MVYVYGFYGLEHVSKIKPCNFFCLRVSRCVWVQPNLGFALPRSLVRRVVGGSVSFGLQAFLCEKEVEHGPS